jgi:hypothetical protein
MSMLEASDFACAESRGGRRVLCAVSVDAQGVARGCVRLWLVGLEGSV